MGATCLEPLYAVLSFHAMAATLEHVLDDAFGLKVPDSQVLGYLANLFGPRAVRCLGLPEMDLESRVLEKQAISFRAPMGAKYWGLLYEGT